MALTSSAFWFALGSIILTNIVLSGDNAVVIALAARHLPQRQQKQAIFWGSAGAIALRIVLTILAVKLLALPYLKTIGAVLLVFAQNYLQDLLAVAHKALTGVPLLANLFHPDRWLLWLGVAFILCVYFFPTGIVGRLRNRR